MSVQRIGSPAFPSEWKTFEVVMLSGVLLYGVLSLIYVPIDGVWKTIAPGIPTADSPASEFVNTSYVLSNSDPVADAAQAVQGGDRRLWAVRASSWSIPGAQEEKFRAYERSYGVRFFYYGCIVHSDEEIEFRNVATAYAERYNKAVLAAVER